ncbi:MAG: hypothetical protein Q7J85_04995 [Bacillota bacterium]|nr:hypothetical protein [Bacillota bacterium]
MVRLTEAPNLILAQETIFNLEELMNFKYIKKYNAREDTGFKYPNLEARNLMVDSLRIASVVGILPYNDDRIASPQWMKRPLTDKVLSYIHYKPEIICEKLLAKTSSY